MCVDVLQAYGAGQSRSENEEGEEERRTKSQTS
jgi:hypothetical protein